MNVKGFAAAMAELNDPKRMHVAYSKSTIIQKGKRVTKEAIVVTGNTKAHADTLDSEFECTYNEDKDQWECPIEQEEAIREYVEETNQKLKPLAIKEPVKGKMQVIDYSDRSILVMGNTKPHKATFGKTFKCIFGKHWTVDGRKVTGWNCAKTKEAEVRAFVALANKEAAKEEASGEDETEATDETTEDKPTKATPKSSKPVSKATAKTAKDRDSEEETIPRKPPKSILKPAKRVAHLYTLEELTNISDFEVVNYLKRRASKDGDIISDRLNMHQALHEAGLIDSVLGSIFASEEYEEVVTLPDRTIAILLKEYTPQQTKGINRQQANIIVAALNIEDNEEQMALLETHFPQLFVNM